jgi:hypothetical protein
VIGDTVDGLCEFLLGGGGVVLGRLVFLEEVVGDLVDSLVGTLRGEYDCNEQF